MLICAVCETSLPGNSRFCPNCGTPVPGQPRTSGLPDPGWELLERMKRILAGRFELIGELGRGGMASVLLARQVSLDRELAIKVLNPGLNHDADLVQRFLREARTQGRLDHPGIVPVYEVYQEGGLNFYTMPRIQGPSLRLFLKRTPRPPIDQVRRFLEESAEALGYAHQQRVIHRDVKPENMLLDEQKNRLILTDFGIAKTLSSATMLTIAGEQLGTPRYMSPDQGDSTRPLDGRSDQYSLGLVGYEMLAGRMALDAENLAELMYKHRFEEPESLAALRPDAPAGLVAAVMRAIRKNRDERYDSMEAFGAALRAEVTLVAPAPPPPLPAATEPAPPPPRTAAAAPAPPPLPAAATAPALTPPPRPVTTSRPWRALAAVALLVGAVLAFLQFRSGSAPRPESRIASPILKTDAGDPPPAPATGPMAPAPIPPGPPAGTDSAPPPAQPTPAGAEIGAVVDPPGLAEWNRARSRFVRFRRGLAADSDSLVRAALGRRAGSLEMLEARAESLAAAGRLPDASRALDAAQTSIGNALRLAARARAVAQKEAALKQAAQNESAPRDAAISHDPVGHNEAPVVEPPPLPAAPPDPAAAIDREVERFGSALAGEELDAIRAAFPKLVLGLYDTSFLTDLFKDAEQMSVTTKPSKVRVTEKGATADVEYELSFIHSRKREAGRKSVRLRFFFAPGGSAPGEDGWELVRFQRR